MAACTVFMSLFRSCCEHSSLSHTGVMCCAVSRSCSCTCSTRWWCSLVAPAAASRCTVVPSLCLTWSSRTWRTELCAWARSVTPSARARRVRLSRCDAPSYCVSLFPSVLFTVRCSVCTLTRECTDKGKH